MALAAVRAHGQAAVWRRGWWLRDALVEVSEALGMQPVDAPRLL
jgi:hypothetical protein